MTIDPTTLTLRIYPDPILRKKAAAIPRVDDHVRAVADAMLVIMRQSEGIGLAAPQVGVPWRIFVVDLPPSKHRSSSDDPPTATDGPVVYINPVLSQPLGAVEVDEEGCLSLPDIRGDVLRPPTIRITALDRDGKTFTSTATGLLARCWQHEMDHLDGVLIIDKMMQRSRLKNKRAIKDLEEMV